MGPRFALCAMRGSTTPKSGFVKADNQCALSSSIPIGLTDDKDSALRKIIKSRYFPVEIDLDPQYKEICSQLETWAYEPLVLVGTTEYWAQPYSE